MSIEVSKTCAAKSAAKLEPFFELHNILTPFFEDFSSFHHFFIPILPHKHYCLFCLSEEIEFTDYPHGNFILTSDIIVLDLGNEHFLDLTQGYSCLKTYVFEK